MKETCQVCGIIGYKQQRGNSLRILHYDGFKDAKRHYVYHQLKKLEVTESNSMEVKNLKISSNPQKEWTGRDLNPRPPRCQRGDHTRLIYPPNKACYEF